MSQASSDREGLRPEYDIRGGIRGKYLERYRLPEHVVFEASVLIVNSTAASPTLGHVAYLFSYVAPLPSTKIQIGELEPVSFGR